MSEFVAQYPKLASGRSVVLLGFRSAGKSHALRQCAAADVPSMLLDGANALSLRARDLEVGPEVIVLIDRPFELITHFATSADERRQNALAAVLSRRDHIVIACTPYEVDILCSQTALQGHLGLDAARAEALAAMCGRLVESGVWALRTSKDEAEVIFRAGALEENPATCFWSHQFSDVVPGIAGSIFESYVPYSVDLVHSKSAGAPKVREILKETTFDKTTLAAIDAAKKGASTAAAEWGAQAASVAAPIAGGAAGFAAAPAVQALPIAAPVIASVVTAIVLGMIVSIWKKRPKKGQAQRDQRALLASVVDAFRSANPPELELIEKTGGLAPRALDRHIRRVLSGLSEPQLQLLLADRLDTLEGEMESLSSKVETHAGSIGAMQSWLASLGLVLSTVMVETEKVSRHLDELVLQNPLATRLGVSRFGIEDLVEIVPSERATDVASPEGIREKLAKGIMPTWRELDSEGVPRREDFTKILLACEEETDRARIVVLSGEMGSGKTILAHQIAAALAQRGHLVVRILNETGQVWASLPRLAYAGERLWILVDDIFESDFRRLLDVDPKLRVTIVATSRSSSQKEIGRVSHLDPVVFPIATPSLAERKDLLRALGLEGTALTAVQRECLAPVCNMNMLLLTSLLITGRRPEERMADEIDSIRRHEPDLVDACHAVFVAFENLIVTPNEFLSHYANEPKAGRMSTNPATRDVIVEAGREDCVRSLHPYYAGAAADALEATLARPQVIERIFARADSGHEASRRYLSALIRAAVKNKVIEVPRRDGALTHKMIACATVTQTVTDAFFWRTAFLDVGLSAAAEQAEAHALTLRPRNSYEVGALIGAHRRRADKEGAINVARAWIQDHEPDALILNTLSGLLGETGSDPMGVIEDALRRAPDDPALRVFAIATTAVRSGRSRDEVDQSRMEKMVTESQAWLHAHPNEAAVRGALLASFSSRATWDDMSRGLVRETTELIEKTAAHGGIVAGLVSLTTVAPPGEFAEIIRTTHAWLARSENEDDILVRARLIASIRKRLNVRALRLPPQWSAARLVDLMGSYVWPWANGRSRASPVVSAYIGLLREHGNEVQCARNAEVIAKWITGSSAQTQVWEAWLAFVGDRGTTAERRLAAERTQMWLTENESAINVWANLLKIEEGLERPDRVVALASTPLRLTPQNEHLIATYLRAGGNDPSLLVGLEQLLRRAQTNVTMKINLARALARTDFGATTFLELATAHPWPEPPVQGCARMKFAFHYAEHLRFSERPFEAVLEFNKILRANPLQAAALAGRGKTFEFLGWFEDAREDLRAAVRIGEAQMRAGGDFDLAPLLGDLGRVIVQSARSRAEWAEAAESFARANVLHPGHSLNLAGLAVAHRGLGDAAKAKEFARAALDSAPPLTGFYLDRVQDILVSA